MGAEGQVNALKLISESIRAGRKGGRVGDTTWSFEVTIGMVNKEGTEIAEALGIPHRATAQDIEAEAYRIRQAYNISAVFILSLEGTPPVQSAHIASAGFESPSHLRTAIQTYLQQSTFKEAT